jgi:hypothetical protein
MSYSLLGAHVNMTTGGLPEIIQEWKPPLVVTLDHSDAWHDVKATSPDTVLVGRLYQEREPDFGDTSLAPVVAARDHCDQILPWAERMGETYSFWQGVNEPVIKDHDSMQRYADFEVERIRQLHSHGYRAAVGSFSVGNPELAYWQSFLPALEAALAHNGALALHEYAWPTLDTEHPWYLLRHRKVYDGEPEHEWGGLPWHLKALPLLITECGLDGLIEQGYPPRGWQVLYGTDPDQYLEQLAWYDAELYKDPYVVGAAIYCCGTPDWHWKSYDISSGLAQVLAQSAKPQYRLAATRLPQPPLESDAFWSEVIVRMDRIIDSLGRKL